MTEQWYVLRSKYHKEPALLRFARERGHALFHPRIRVNPTNPRARTVKPLFPGYMFVKTNMAETGVSEFQWMPFSLGLITFGGEPATVPESMIHEIRQRAERSLAGEDQVELGLEAGDPVRVTQGLFSGYEGFFEGKIPGRERVRVLLSLMDEHYKSVQLDLNQLEY